MSLSGSSASRKSICAITRFASSSSMNVGKKMIRSLRSREKMSNARSPRGVCSMTIGTSAILLSLSRLDGGRRRPPSLTDLRLVDQEVQGLPLPQPVAEGVQVAALLHHTTDRRRRAPAAGGQPVHLGVQVGC